MPTRKHEASISLAFPPQDVWDALVRPSAIRAWWMAARVIVVPKPGGVWAAAWGADEDTPDYISTATMTLFQPPPAAPARLRFEDYTYHTRFGAPPFAADFVTEFSIHPEDGGRSQLKVVQDGFPAGPEADAFYAACERGWAETLANLKRFLGG